MCIKHEFCVYLHLQCDNRGAKSIFVYTNTQNYAHCISCLYLFFAGIIFIFIIFFISFAICNLKIHHHRRLRKLIWEITFYFYFFQNVSNILRSKKKINYIHIDFAIRSYMKGNQKKNRAPKIQLLSTSFFHSDL